MNAMHEPPHGPRREERIWATFWIAINTAVIVGVLFLIPVFVRWARSQEVSGSRTFLFYLVAALAVGNAIRRIIVQALRLRGQGGDKS